jgi:hypothetical protein
VEVGKGLGSMEEIKVVEGKRDKFMRYVEVRV